MSYIDMLHGSDRNTIIRRAATIAADRINDGHDDYINERRANIGQAAVMIGCSDYAKGEGIFVDTKDALSNIIHFLHRAGVDPGEVWDAAMFSAEGDLEDGPEAARDEDVFPEDAA